MPYCGNCNKEIKGAKPWADHMMSLEHRRNMELFFANKNSLNLGI